MSEAVEKMMAEVHKSMDVVVAPGATAVVLVVVDKDPSRNKIQQIPIHHGIAFSSGYAYDRNADSYMVPCVEFYELGVVRLAAEIVMPSANGWRVKCPLPETLVQKLLSRSQRQIWQGIQDKYRNKDRFEITFIQMRDCQF